ncbi:unnamed protein product [Gadus morhua 'NCC']
MMGIKELKSISKIFSGIFLLTSLNFCPGIHSVGLVASNNVLVAHSGETVVLHYIVTPQLNQTEGTIQCLSPKNSPMPTTPFSLKHPTYVLVNVNLSYSGMYRCWLSLEGWSEVNSSDMAYWFLHVTDNDYEVPRDESMTIVGVLTAVLGISSVACSLYLFKGHVPSIAKRGSRATEGETREGGEEHKDPAPQGAMATSPADVYASLEHRPGSVYDTLEPPTAREAPGPTRADSGRSKGKEEETPHGDQNQDALECFYENF